MDKMLDGFSIPLEQMEKLEKKYNVNLHLIQFAEGNERNNYYLKGDDGSLTFIGHTLGKVEEFLESNNKLNNIIEGENNG